MKKTWIPLALGLIGIVVTIYFSFRATPPQNSSPSSSPAVSTADTIVSRTSKVRDTDVVLALAGSGMLGTQTYFVLYKDNLAIFTNDESTTGFSEVKFTDAEGAPWRAIAQSLTGLKSTYDVSNPEITDQPTYTVSFTDRDGQPRVISISGVIEKTSGLPAQLTTAYDRCRHFTDTKGTVWLPPKLKLVLWTEPESEGSVPAAWPASLPFVVTTKHADAVELDNIDCVKYRRQVLGLFDAARQKKPVTAQGNQYRVQFDLAGDPQSYRAAECFSFQPKQR